MLNGFIGGIIVAWFLTLFNVDHYCIQAAKELLHADISVATYYIVFGIIGAITGGR